MGASLEAVNWDWSCVRRFLPFDLDQLAVETGALKRRRGVADGEALVRSLLLLGLNNSSLQRAALLASELGIGKMNKTAYIKPVCRSEQLLQSIFLQTLTFSTHSEPDWAGLRLIAVDATCLCGPGANTTDQKLHTVYDLSKGLPLSVEITDRRGGEALWRHLSFKKGDLILSDAGYGYNKSFLHALNLGANLLIRFNFRTVTLFDELGERILAEQADKGVPEEGFHERIVFMPDWEAPLRAIASRNDVGEPSGFSPISAARLSQLQRREPFMDGDGRSNFILNGSSRSLTLMNFPPETVPPLVLGFGPN